MSEEEKDIHMSVRSSLGKILKDTIPSLKWWKDVKMLLQEEADFTDRGLELNRLPESWHEVLMSKSKRKLAIDEEKLDDTLPDMDPSCYVTIKDVGLKWSIEKMEKKLKMGGVFKSQYLLLEGNARYRHLNVHDPGGSFYIWQRLY